MARPFPDLDHAPSPRRVSPDLPPGVSRPAPRGELVVPPAAVWASLPPALQMQVGRILLRVIREAVCDADDR
jgi:hypothetical protein